MTRASEVNERRRRQGTHPKLADELKTRFLRGVEGIEVDLLDGPMNPYRSIYSQVISTWLPFGGWTRKCWEDADIETRVQVVRAALAIKAYPPALEAPKFTFEISGVSRSSFDQIARARIGVCFASLGTRDNDFSAVPFRISENTWRDANRLAKKKEAIRHVHRVYHAEVAARGPGYWDPTFETARELLPMSLCWRFHMTVSYAALRGFCAQRMTFSEQSDTVAVAWLLRDRMMKADAYPLLGAYLRPRCDAAGRCCFHVPNDESEHFRGLNVSCGRNPQMPGADPEFLREYADHQCPSTDPMVFREQIGIPIPEANEERPEGFELTIRDNSLFCEDGPFVRGRSGSAPAPVK
jgi:thymidylate synthase ThyX